MCLQVDGSQTMHTEDERNFSSVMHIMFDQVPDDPLTRKGFFFSILISLMENLLWARSVDLVIAS
jgi:hypothetical protein